MGLFGFGKKKTITCDVCGRPMPSGTGKIANGKVCCEYCYRSLTQTAGTGNTGSTGSTLPSANTSRPIPGNGAPPVAIQQIKKTFDATNTRYTEGHVGDQWEIVANASDSGKSYQLKFICKNDSHSAVALRVFSLARVEPSRHNRLFPLLNDLQDQYRFVRFTLDSDNEVKLEYDFPTEGGDVGPVALEMMIRTVKILDDAYPQIAKVAWG